MQEYAVTLKDTQNAWSMLEHMLTRQYMDLVPQMSVVPDTIGIVDALKNVRITKITRILYDKSEDNLTKFNNLFTALHSAGGTVFVLLCNKVGTTEIYLGVKNDSAENADSSLGVLQKSLNGNFPGISQQPQFSADLKDLACSINQGNYVACVTGVPSLKEAKNAEDFAQGLEKIIDAMGETPYIALFIARPIAQAKLDDIENAYQDLYSALSLLNIGQVSLSEQKSIALGENISRTLSKTVSTSIAHTNTCTKSTSTSDTVTKTASNGRTYSESQAQADTSSRSSTDSKAHTDTLSHTHSHSHSISKSKTTTWSAGISIIVANASRSSASTRGTSDTDSDAHTRGTSDTNSHAETTGRANTKTNTIGTAHTHGDAIANGKTQGEIFSNAEGKTVTEGNTKGETVSSGENKTTTLGTTASYNYNIVDKHVAESLKLLDEQLARIRSAKNYGAWDWAGYFIANDPITARNGADIYTGILSGEQTGIERSKVILWNESESQKLKAVKKSLAMFEHPAFEKDGFRLNATSLITTPEVAAGMSLPQKSLPNIPVFESTHFGRAVVAFDNFCNTERSCQIGYISHLGNQTHQPVSLNIDSLCGHTFITGSTGSGKSKAVNNILSRLKKKNIKFLVIEPAKGEYKDIWGGTKGCKVLGTNPAYAELLKINPFSFPKNIHVMEHIDRLIEILNAVWPMYAVMPAMLKDAVEKTYEACGWNLLTSSNRFGQEIFPDFVELLKILPEVIKKSQYSEEVKGNFAGALITRVHSLTNGYYRFIFQKDEISPSILFENDTIVDLSRVGASETKSLLMGILFLKLQEYRISQNSTPDQQLKHVTVLEEAHHLLRHTSIEQNSETANLQGKSVEMLTNAIAEMRTYGEGFIIADQAPGLLDQSVIRNTNTKIIFRLPDYDDRLLVGKAQRLNEAQIDELARLRTGCASIYQNDWQEAVLCQFTLFKKEELYGVMGTKEYTPPATMDIEDSRLKTEKLLLQCLLKEFLSRKNYEIDKEASGLLSMYFPWFVEQRKTMTSHDALWFLNELFIKKAIEETSASSNFGIWHRELQRILKNDLRIAGLSMQELQTTYLITYKILAMYDKNPEQKSQWIQMANSILKGGII